MLKKLLFLCLFLSAAAFAAESVEEKAPSNRVYFLSLADIHFDPFASCNKIKPCPLIVKLRHAPVDQWPALLAQYDTKPHYKMDTNFPLLRSALQASQAIANKYQAKFVIILGDFLGHDFRHYYKAYSDDKKEIDYQNFVNKTFTLLTNELSKAFPSLDVYSVVGNNDSYHNDYVTVPKGSFFKDNSQLLSRLIKDKNNRLLFQQQFANDGYYALVLPYQPNLLLIVLNSNLFSSNARGMKIDAAANEQLNWLHTQLEKAKEKHQTVLIGMHIPMGVDVYASLQIKLFTLISLWKHTYTQRFQSELQQYAPQIAGIFAGHLHADWFQVLTFNENKIPITGTPSISPLFGNNPGFKVYSYSSKTHQLINYVTYFYPLSTTKTWDLEYDFNLIYQAHCKQCPMLKSMSALAPNNALAGFYKSYYSVSTHSQPITTKWDPYYWCAIWKINKEDYQQCIH